MVEIEYELDRGYFTIPVLVEVAYVEPEPSVGIWGGWEIGQTIITEDVYDEETGTLVYRKEDEMKLTSAEEERLLELAEEARELERQPNPASTAATRSYNPNTDEHAALGLIRKLDSLGLVRKLKF